MASRHTQKSRISQEYEDILSSQVASRATHVHRVRPPMAIVKVEGENRYIVAFARPKGR